MNADDLKKRTKSYALRVLKLCQALPNTPEGWAIRKQLTRSGTSVGANYRAVCRARSNAEFIAKIGVVIEESDESAFWLELIIESGMLSQNLVESLLLETNEIVAIMVSSSNTAHKTVNNLKSAI